MYKKSKLASLLQSLKDNSVELWAIASIFIGLPLTAGVYFDWRASLLVFVVASSIIGTLAVRNK